MWIELHAELLTHPKLIRLSNKLAIEMTHAFGVVASLWAWAALYAVEGDLTKHERFEIAKGIGWSGSADELIDALIYARFLDKEGDRLLIHNWSKRGVRLIMQSRKRQSKYDSKPEKENNHVHNSGSVALNSARASL